MGVTLEVTMGVHISVGTSGSPNQSMAGQWLALSNTVSQKIRFSGRSSIDEAFSFVPIKTCQISSQSIVFWAPWLPKVDNALPLVKKKTERRLERSSS